MSLREQILAANDLPRERVTVPEWGVDVWVRTLTGRERDAFEAAVFQTKGKDVQVKLENARANLVARCLVDESGARVFTDGDVAALGGKSALVLSRLYDVASRLNGLGDKEIEELGKVSEDDPSVSSGS